MYALFDSYNFEEIDVHGVVSCTKLVLNIGTSSENDHSQPKIALKRAKLVLLNFRIQAILTRAQVKTFLNSFKFHKVLYKNMVQIRDPYIFWNLLEFLTILVQGLCCL